MIGSWKLTLHVINTIISVQITDTILAFIFSNCNTDNFKIALLLATNANKHETVAVFMDASINRYQALPKNSIDETICPPPPIR